MWLLFYFLTDFLENMCTTKKKGNKYSTEGRGGKKRTNTDQTQITRQIRSQFLFFFYKTEPSYLATVLRFKILSTPVSSSCVKRTREKNKWVWWAWRWFENTHTHPHPHPPTRTHTHLNDAIHAVDVEKGSDAILELARQDFDLDKKKKKSKKKKEMFE